MTLVKVVLQVRFSRETKTNLVPRTQLHPNKQYYPNKIRITRNYYNNRSGGIKKLENWRIKQVKLNQGVIKLLLDQR